MTDKQMVIACQALCASRNDNVLTAPVSCTVAKGDYIQLRGPNGCGKSTFLRHLAGLLPAIKGIIIIAGEPCPAQDIPALRTISYLGHDDAMQADLTGYENYELLTGQSRNMLVQSSLYERQIATYSAGQRQKLSLHILDDSHDIWLLDEPSASLDAANLAYLEERIAGYLALGGAVIASTHTPLAQSLISQIITLTPAEPDAPQEAADEARL